MQKERRLRRRKDFAAAYRKGRVYGNQLLVLRVVLHAGVGARFGFVTGKVVGNAVVRNRVKRRLRAAAVQMDVRPEVDIVVGARKAAAAATYHTLYISLAALIERAGLVRSSEAAGAQETT
jgi:ribonuclease P protein component